MAASAHQRPAVAKSASPRAFPIMEIFGPTIQGEGPDAGRPAYFVRFGGCDYRCSWCDSLYAVDPHLVKAESRRLTTGAIVAELASLEEGPAMAVLTGGNPAIFELADLVSLLHRRRMDVSVETQGSVWRDWLNDVDRLVVSPKGPSSDMDTPAHRAQFGAFMDLAIANPSLVLKVVVFDERDLEWAELLASTFTGVPFFVSAGTDVDAPADETLERLAGRYRWLCESVARSRALAYARVLPQLHVVAWGMVRGV
ncbi:MAG TPA: 7-carboxy-7-deazaguanine synthase QueE [Solirubrobacteraceae bacterium]|nr:7-carboxy-7-deazaguanine synthase QueE [Solirubrobacteraceae bacterium]